MILLPEAMGEIMGQVFAQTYGGWGLTKDEERILLCGPGNPLYKQTWEGFLTKARMTDSYGDTWKLDIFDGDLMGVRLT